MARTVVARPPATAQTAAGRQRNPVPARPALARRLELGLRWLRCGWRLFSRNPWLLTGMGVTASALLALLAAVPLVGGLLVALIAPVFLSGSYIAIDELTRQKAGIPPGLRLAVLRQSPRGLVRGLHEPERAIPLLLVALCSMAVSLAIHVVIWFIAGSTWAMPWNVLGGVSLLTVALAFVLASGLCLLLAASLIYALPLAFLQEEGLGTAVPSSLRASTHHAPALVVLLLLAIAPLVLRAIAHAYSPLAAHLVVVLAGGFALPLVATGLYCSFRSLFPAPAPMSATGRSSSQQLH